MPQKLRNDLASILRGNVLILFLTWLLLGFGNNMVHKFDGKYFAALGASNVMLGYMGALTFGMMALLQIPGGHLADTWGRKRVIVVFTFIMAFSMLIFAFAPSWEYIVLGLVISNLALLYQPALFSIVMDSLPEHRRAEGFAITNLSALPALAAPIVGGAMIYYLGLIPGMRLGYFILFLLSLTAAFMRLFLKETVKVKRREEREKFLSFFKVLRTVDSRAKWMILVASLESSSAGMVGYFIILYSSSYTSSLVFGIAMAIGMLVSTILAVFVGRMGDARGKERFFIGGIFLSSLAYFIFIFPGVAFLFLFSLISGLAMALYQPSVNGLIADLVPLETRGRFTGAYLFTMYLITMLFTSSSGYLYGISPALLFSVASILALIAGVAGLKVFFGTQNL